MVTSTCWQQTTTQSEDVLSWVVDTDNDWIRWWAFPRASISPPTVSDGEGGLLTWV